MRASAARLSQDQMEDARISGPLRQRSGAGQDRLWSGQLDVEVEAVSIAETTETDPVTLVATVTCQGGGEGHLRDHCGSDPAGRPSDHPGGSGAGAR